jgi:hypothetical protein
MRRDGIHSFMRKVILILLFSVNLCAATEDHILIDRKAVLSGIRVSKAKLQITGWDLDEAIRAYCQKMKMAEPPLQIPTIIVFADSKDDVSFVTSYDRENQQGFWRFGLNVKKKVVWAKHGKVEKD